LTIATCSDEFTQWSCGVMVSTLACKLEVSIPSGSNYFSPQARIVTVASKTDLMAVAVY